MPNLGNKHLVVKQSCAVLLGVCPVVSRYALLPIIFSGAEPFNGIETEVVSVNCLVWTGQDDRCGVASIHLRNRARELINLVTDFCASLNITGQQLWWEYM